MYNVQWTTYFVKRIETKNRKLLAADERKQLGIFQRVCAFTKKYTKVSVKMDRTEHMLL